MRLGSPGNRIIMAALVLAASVAALACSPMTRYRVLNFMFDGVPPPPGMVVELEPLSPDRRERSLTAFTAGLRTLREEATPPTPPATLKSVHEPYKERKCQTCHDMTTHVDEIPKDASLCDQCHKDQRIEEGWDHGPINIGTCVPCHVPHASIYEGLLSTPLPNLCLDCHVDVVAGEPEHHDVPNFAKCVECHDPHRMY